MKAIDYNKSSINNLLENYDYQPDLTKKLDNLHDVPFTQSIINEIVLWKVNRYVFIDNEILENTNKLKNLTQGEHRQAESVLETLLIKDKDIVRGVDLPMASTILRFRNPKVFQIIDRHAYRALYDEDFSLYKLKSIDQKVSTYFKYLDDIIDLCRKKNLEFQIIDRLLYEFDKKVNGRL